MSITTRKTAQRRFFLSWRAIRFRMVLLIHYGRALLQFHDGIAQACGHAEIMGGIPGMVGIGNNEKRAGSVRGRVSDLSLFSQYPIHVCPAYGVDGAALSSSQSIDEGRSHAKRGRAKEGGIDDN
ncbi:hypothetical protein [Sinorhizobium fredii]|uniref:hypothetical protein n=1 Tax=Rhizobium fredii TaxID=380 RepID=UPI0005B44CE7|nr:hypothetical protein [Sinorhizobium fredii]